MTIRYNNGLTLEAVLLSRTETTMRVAAQGSDDVMELKRLAGTWVTDDCEPVQVEFAWGRPGVMAPVSEADCICSHELAAQLIHLLYTGEDLPMSKPAPMSHVDLSAMLRGVVS